MRLNQYLASCGCGSRRACEKLITAGRISVNGQLCAVLATRVADGDTVALDGEPVLPKKETTLLLYKPPGLICTRDDPQGRPTIYELLPPHLHDLHYVGRLDLDSEGLILLTNSGEFSQKLTHPKHEVEKEYTVTLDHAFDPRHRDDLLKGVETDEGLASAVSVHVVSPRRVKLVLTQGLKRQVRNMFAALGYQVKRLVRTRIGGLEAPLLKPGKWRKLNPGDIQQIESPPPRLKRSRPRKPIRRRKPSSRQGGKGRS